MRENVGLAGLAASRGLIAVVAGVVSVGAAPLAFLRLALAAITLAVAARVNGRLHLLRPGPHLRVLLLAGITVVALEPTGQRVSEAVAGVGSTEP